MYAPEIFIILSLIVLAILTIICIGFYIIKYIIGCLEYKYDLYFNGINDEIAIEHLHN